MKRASLFGGGFFSGPRIGQASLPPGCLKLTSEEWAAAEKAMTDKWTASGKNTLDGLCAVVTFPGSPPNFLQQCVYPDGGAGGTSGELSAFEGDAFPPSCEEGWRKVCETRKPGDVGYDACQQATVPPAPAPSPAPPETPPEAPSTPVTNLSPAESGFQAPCTRQSMSGVRRLTRDFFGQSAF
jgi:hypothetical protein